MMNKTQISSTTHTLLTPPTMHLSARWIINCSVFCEELLSVIDKAASVSCHYSSHEPREWAVFTHCNSISKIKPVFFAQFSYVRRWHTNIYYSIMLGIILCVYYNMPQIKTSMNSCDVLDRPDLGLAFHFWNDTCDISPQIFLEVSLLCWNHRHKTWAGMVTWNTWEGRATMQRREFAHVILCWCTFTIMLCVDVSDEEVHTPQVD